MKIPLLSLLVVSLVVAIQCSIVHMNIDELHIKAPGPQAFTNQTVDLGGTWQVTNANGSVKLEGTVPGQIQTDLLAAKIIGDPYVGFNDYNLMWVLWDNWTYTKTFTLNSSLTSQSSIILVCEGIDTIATITVNGKLVGATDNMFRRYEFNLAGMVQAGQNTITVAFSSAASYAAAKAATYPYEFPQVVFPNAQGNVTARNVIRKEQCSFAWDWGPCFAPQGIWRTIYIVAFSDAVINEVTPQVFPVSFPKTFYVKVDVYVTAAAMQTADASATIADLKSSGSVSNVQLVKGENFITFNVSVANPSLWYPAGYGSQPLYTISVSLSVGGNVISEITKRIGFRLFELVEDPMPNGKNFYFRVNSIPIFAKGANWIPADAFESRSTPEVLQNLLKSAAQANMNVIRTWGGGVYQHSAYYDIADELGLMVWQEFMFACATYPRDHEFLDSVAHEVKHQVRRLAHHASIILWSGNNENEVSLSPPGYGWYTVANANPYLYIVDYAELYLNTIYPALLSADRSRPFIPSSPSNGLISTDPIVGMWGNPGSSDYGDVHYYNDGADCTNVTFFPSPRFASEYGFQSHPSMFAWLQVANESELSWNSSLVNHRQHHPGGNEVLLNMMTKFFKVPSLDESGFPAFVYLSQVVQSMCYKAEATHYRRLKGDPTVYTMGSIYWQLNDIWQAPTWSGTEYGGRWKLLHYAAKNFYAPLLVSSYEDPVDTYNVHVTSDVQQAITGTVVISLLDYNGKTLYTWSPTYNIPSLGSMAVYNNSIKSMISQGGCTDRTLCFLTLSLLDSSNTQVASDAFYLSTLNNVDLPVPTITFSGFQQTSPDTVTFTVTSTQVAPHTFLQTPFSGTFNDNGVLLLPGISMNMTFSGWEAVPLSSFQTSVTAITIANTY